MRDISLHVLDIVQNSIRAESTLVIISIEITQDGWMRLVIKDNGKGMTQEDVQKLENPFFTTRTTRPIGLGVPLLGENAKRTHGELKVQSDLGVGTELHASFDTKHIDCIPIGNMGQTIATLCLSYPTQCDFTFSYKQGDIHVDFDTRQIKNVLGEVPMNTPDVLLWVQEAIEQGMCKQG